jgi:porin
MKTEIRLATLAFALGTSCTLQALPYATPDTWGGSLAARPRLSGDWGGVRDDMAKKGVVLDLDTYWMPQTIASGGKDEGSGGSWGNAIITLNVDTQKAGLWPGGFLKVQSVSSFGSNIARDMGALVPTNLSWILPSIEEDTGLQELTYTQFLSPQFGMFLGKINTISPTNVLHGDYTTGFSHPGLNFPLALAMVPLSAYGGGALYLPSHDVTLAAMALDPDGTIMSNGLSEAFDSGVIVLASADVKVKPFGLPGHQNVTFAWSNKDRTSLIQDPTNLARLFLNERFPRLGDPGPILVEILERHAPALLVPAVPLNQEQETWSVNYSFEQFLWQSAGDPKRGLGTFVSVGGSDGKANPVKYSYSLGLVGHGLVAGRAHDTTGIAWARTDFSEHFAPFLRNTFDLGLDYEDVVEIYYNAALMPWLNVTPNLQVIYPALNKTLDPARNFQELDTTLILGVRFGVRF